MKLDKLKAALVELVDSFGNIVILNLLLVLCCLPVITAPAALTATYSCALSMARGEGFDMRRFWRSFKRDFLLSLGLGLVSALALAILIFDIYVLKNMALPRAFSYVLYGLGFMAAAALMYLFPLAARFSFKFGQYLSLSVALAVKNLPQTILMLLMSLLPVLLFFANAELALRLIVLWFIFGFALTAYLKARMLHEIFRPYIPDAEQAEEEG